MIYKIKPLFTATANSTGGRNGHSETADGEVKVDLSIPKEMGGPGLPGKTTPEHLFATGYAACFGGALDVVGKKHKTNTAGATTTCAVTFGVIEDGTPRLAVKMRIVDKSVPTEELKKLVEETHEKICPYSHATRGNVEVLFDVEGA
jgi:osmotically inducible protein OsmC